MLKSKGVCIVAVDHPYYGRMAFNLAKTIKAVDKNCPIQVICNGASLDHVGRRDLWVFDHITPVVDKNGFKLKLQVDQLSIFDETILIDADCAWVSTKSPLYLLDWLSGRCDFTGITEGFHDYDNPQASEPAKNYYFWADPEELQSEYKLSGRIYQWRTEFMYVKKSPLTRDLLFSARYVYDNAHHLKSLKRFANHVPDELGINVAACAHGVAPHSYLWRPTFWHRIHTGNDQPSIEQLQASYFAISCGSNVTSGGSKKLYDRIVKASSFQLGMGHVFPAINKRDMIPHRQNM